jgi:hypothetical protein
MKKALLILSLLMLSRIAGAQPVNAWIGAGTTWHYGIVYFMPNYPIGFNRYYYSGDTAIAGRIFQVVEAEQQLSTTLNGVVTIGDTTALPTRYFHTSNDTVYVLSQNNALQFAWHLNPNVGDVWDFGSHLMPLSNTYKHAYTQVDSIKQVVYNGQTLKEIYSHPAKDSLGTPIYGANPVPDTAVYWVVGHANCINNRFGPKYGFNWIDYLETNQFTDGLPADNLLCFEATNFPTVQVFGNDCNNGILIANGAAPWETPFSVFPNPTEGLVHLAGWVRGDAIAVYNAIGQRVMLRTGDDLPVLDLSGLPSGLYSVVVSDGRFGTVKETSRLVRK